MGLYTAEQLALLPTIETALTDDGWTVTRARLGNSQWAAAVREFDTITGGTNAQIHIQPVSDDVDSHGFRLTGSFLSKGHNVLSTCFCHVAVNHTAEQASIALTLFLSMVNREISQSWSCRLLAQNC